MIKQETKQKLEQAEGLLKKLERIDRFSTKYRITPSNEAGKLCREMYALAESFPDIQVPKNQDELLSSEAKRRMHGEASYLEQRLSGGLYDFHRVLDILGIPQGDIDALRPWLEENKDKTQEAVERLFHTKDIEGYELPLRADIPDVRRQSEEVAGAHVQKYHRTLGKFLQDLTNVGEFLRDINATSTTEERSYFSPLTNNLAISIPAICFSSEDGTLHIRDGELIRLYGHEGMGHALNRIVTQSNGLPYIFTKDSALTISTEESLAQFYENVLLEDLKRSPETQRKLGIEHMFDDIYQEAKDTEQLRDYQSRLFHYGIAVMANKSLGKSDDPETVRKKINVLNQVAIDKSYVSNLVHNNRYNIDPEGNLNSNLVSELRYCARPVPRTLEEFQKRGIHYEGEGRDLIDSTLLKGFWTPIGFVDNARLKAEEAKSS
jgi:hypothetical protein